LAHDKDQAYYLAEHNDISIDAVAENKKKQQVIWSKLLDKKDWTIETATAKTIEVLNKMEEKANKVIDNVLMKNALDNDPLGIEIKTFSELYKKGISVDKIPALLPLLKEAFKKEYPDKEKFFEWYNTDNIIISNSIQTAYDFDINRFIGEYLKIYTLGLEDNYVVWYTTCSQCWYKGQQVGQVMDKLDPKNLVVARCDNEDFWAKNIVPKLQNIVEGKIKK